MRIGPVAVGVVLVASAALAACGASDTDEARAAVDTSGTGGLVTVFAAASLTESFNEIGRAFEAEHPDIEVRFSFGASSQLAAQIAEGAPATVFAAADTATMTQALTSLPGAPTPTVFTRNKVTIAVEPGNPKAIDGVGDLTDDDLIVVVCAPDVPCGRYADRVFTLANVEVHPRSLEVNVKAVVSKVALGEADAGIVYTSDIVAADGRVDGVEIPAASNVEVDYPIVAVDPNDELATSFVEYVLSPAGQSIMQQHGFVPISATTPP